MRGVLGILIKIVPCIGMMAAPTKWVNVLILYHYAWDSHKMNACATVWHDAKKGFSNLMAWNPPETLSKFRIGPHANLTAQAKGVAKA